MSKSKSTKTKAETKAEIEAVKERIANRPKPDEIRARIDAAVGAAQMTTVGRIIDARHRALWDSRDVYLLARDFPQEWDAWASNHFESKPRQVTHQVFAAVFGDAEAAEESWGKATQQRQYAQVGALMAWQCEGKSAEEAIRYIRGFDSLDKAVAEYLTRYPSPLGRPRPLYYWRLFDLEHREYFYGVEPSENAALLSLARHAGIEAGDARFGFPPSALKERLDKHFNAQFWDIGETKSKSDKARFEKPERLEKTTLTEAEVQDAVDNLDALWVLTIDKADGDEVELEDDGSTLAFFLTEDAARGFLANYCSEHWQPEWGEPSDDKDELIAQYFEHEGGEYSIGEGDHPSQYLDRGETFQYQPGGRLIRVGRKEEVGIEDGEQDEPKKVLAAPPVETAPAPVETADDPLVSVGTQISSTGDGTQRYSLHYSISVGDGESWKWPEFRAEVPKSLWMPAMQALSTERGEMLPLSEVTAWLAEHGLEAMPTRNPRQVSEGIDPHAPPVETAPPVATKPEIIVPKSQPESAPVETEVEADEVEADEVEAEAEPTDDLRAECRKWFDAWIQVATEMQLEAMVETLKRETRAADISAMSAA